MRFKRPSVKSLSGLTIGSLVLTPEFAPDVLAYTCATANASNKVKATATDEGDTIKIMNGETEVENNTAAHWEEGENTLTVTVTDRDDPTATTEYVVTVTYTAETEEEE